MSGYKSRLLLAAICAACGLSLGVTLPARANLQVCNKYQTTAFVAIGYSQGENLWYSQGWWEVPQGQCTTLLTGSLKPGTYFYLYAFNQEGTRIWQGNDRQTWFCIKPRENFQLVSPGTACTAPGTRKELFWEIQVQESSQSIDLN
jgi:uncharacterized membrane protein